MEEMSPVDKRVLALTLSKYVLVCVCAVVLLDLPILLMFLGVAAFLATRQIYNITNRGDEKHEISLLAFAVPMSFFELIVVGMATIVSVSLRDQDLGLAGFGLLLFGTGQLLSLLTVLAVKVGFVRRVLHLTHVQP